MKDLNKSQAEQVSGGALWLLIPIVPPFVNLLTK